MKVVFLIQHDTNKYSMKLSNAALTAISKRKTILSLALELNLSEQWMRRVIEKNKPNGPLTTIGALKVIKNETNLTDAEILEPEPAIAASE